MEYRITKVYVVEARDRREATRRILSDGEVHLQIISVQEVKTAGESSMLGGRQHTSLADHSAGSG